MWHHWTFVDSCMFFPFVRKETEDHKTATAAAPPCRMWPDGNCWSSLTSQTHTGPIRQASSRGEKADEHRSSTQSTSSSLTLGWSPPAWPQSITSHSVLCTIFDSRSHPASFPFAQCYCGKTKWSTRHFKISELLGGFWAIWSGFTLCRFHIINNERDQCEDTDHKEFSVFSTRTKVDTLVPKPTRFSSCFNWLAHVNLMSPFSISSFDILKLPSAGPHWNPELRTWPAVARHRLDLQVSCHLPSSERPQTKKCFNPSKQSSSTLWMFLLFPVQYRGHKWAGLHVISWLLCALAGALYAAAMLLYDTELRFLVKVLPWLMSAVCCTILDVLVSFQGALQLDQELIRCGEFRRQH